MRGLFLPAPFMDEFAIRGATHWILRGINSPRGDTSLAILIPVLLNSACKLENDLLQYQQAGYRWIRDFDSRWNLQSEIVPYHEPTIFATSQRL